MLEKDTGESPHGILANMLDCNIVVWEFELQFHYYIHFKTNSLGKAMNPLISLVWRQIKIKRSPDEQPFKSVGELVHLNIIITKRGVYFFRTCEDGAVWHLIPRRISPCSESFLGHIGTGILYGGVNLELDWPPLARGFQISHYTHTHQGH